LKDEADDVATKHGGSSVEPVLLDVVHRKDLLDSLVSSADVVISLLPYALHPMVAQSCLDAGTHMVTASYCSPQMHELQEQAVAKGVTFMHEVGLDPGLDHLLALECFREVKQAGGKVESFISYCGGLPAPEFSDNPLRYSKFVF